MADPEAAGRLPAELDDLGAVTRAADIAIGRSESAGI